MGAVFAERFNRTTRDFLNRPVFEKRHGNWVVILPTTKNLVRTADLMKTFLKTDTTNYSYILYKITEVIRDTIPSYRIDYLPKRYNRALLKKTKLTMKENHAVLRALNLN